MEVTRLMGWETRPGTKNRYYCLTKRRNGRDVHEYFGRGEAAEQAAAAVEQRRQQREENRQAREAFEAQISEAALPLDDLCGLAEQMAHAALTAAGYHRPDRNKWRKRSNAHYQPANGSGAAEGDLAPAAPASPPG
jgi:hypothetical protein